MLARTGAELFPHGAQRACGERNVRAARRRAHEVGARRHAAAATRSVPRSHDERPPVDEVNACTGLDRVTVVHPDGTVALRDVTLLARPGELLAVLGPSGCGKSTALRAIAGLTKLASGRVLIAGQITTAEPAYRDVAMVFENTHLVPFMGVARNMSFGLESRHVPKDQVRARVDQQARRLRITRLLGGTPGSISAGERGQVGVGRALVRTPKAFLLDEPLAHVDAQERARMRRVIAETVKQAGVSTVYVTHDKTDALAIGDRVAVLNACRVAQIGTPASSTTNRPICLSPTSSERCRWASSRPAWSRRGDSPDIRSDGER